MNKTIYLRDEEVPLWERARELAGDKLSPVIVSALRQFVVAEEAKPRGFERIEVEFNDSKDHNLPKRKAFYGRWVFPPSKPIEIHREDGQYVHSFTVAVAAKGSAVVHHWLSDEESQWAEEFAVYPSLEAAAADAKVNYAARSAIKKIGVPIEELDI